MTNVSFGQENKKAYLWPEIRKLWQSFIDNQNR